MLDDLLDLWFDAPSEHNGEPIAVAMPPSEYALECDLWTERVGFRLADQVVGQSAAEMADCFGAVFDPSPLPSADCVDAVRHQWFKSLLEQPEAHAMRQHTMLDVGLSEIAAQAVANQWASYRATHEKPADEDDVRQAAQLLRSCRKAAQQVDADVQEAADGGRAFGLEPGEAGHMDASRLRDVFAKVRDNRTLRRIVELAGRFRRVAQAKQRTKTTHGFDDVVGVTLGGDIGRLLPSELLRLEVPELELDQLRRIAERQALVREHVDCPPQARGPIMVFVDESGSMSGDGIAHAKGLALAMAWVAKHQRRWCCLVGWSSAGQVNPLVLSPTQRGMENHLMRWCEHFYHGGTRPPVSQMESLYLTTGAPLGKTDVLWVTDGDCSFDAGPYKAFAAKYRARTTVLAVGCEAAGFDCIADEKHVLSAIDPNCAAVGDVLSL